ncbi:hypothetical protein PENTCL1PPCAC_26104, partial [Pristionchus entomophagus]
EEEEEEEVKQPTVTKKVEDNEKKNGSSIQFLSEHIQVVEPTSDSSIQLVGRVYRDEITGEKTMIEPTGEVVEHLEPDVNTGRVPVVIPETKDAKNKRMNCWLDDSFNRTMS